MAKGLLVLAVMACVASSLAACKSPEEIQREQDQADERRCAGMGVPITPGDPQYVQCRMWAAEMRQQEEQDRRQAWLAALAAYGAMQQQRAPAYQAPLSGYAGGDDDQPPPPPRWIVPPAPPPATWCRPVGRWMSCTSQ